MYRSSPRSAGSAAGLSAVDGAQPVSSTAGHYDDYLASHAFFAIGVNGAGYRAAFPSFRNHPCSDGQFRINRCGFEELNLHGPGPPCGQSFSRPAWIEALFPVIERLGRARGVAVDKHARYPTIEDSRIRAVVFLGMPSSDRFVSLDETLQPKSHGIVSSATVTAANGIFLVQAILESRGIGHLNLLALREKNGDEDLGINVRQLEPDVERR